MTRLSRKGEGVQARDPGCRHGLDSPGTGWYLELIKLMSSLTGYLLVIRLSIQRGAPATKRVCGGKKGPQQRPPGEGTPGYGQQQALNRTLAVST